MYFDSDPDFYAGRRDAEREYLADIKADLRREADRSCPTQDDPFLDEIFALFTQTGMVVSDHGSSR